MFFALLDQKSINPHADRPLPRSMFPRDLFYLCSANNRERKDLIEFVLNTNSNLPDTNQAVADW